VDWLIEHDRALGTSHQARNQPCQDHITFLTSKDQSWHSICISDGAGSAKYSEISSKFISEKFCMSLMDTAYEIDEKGPGSWVNDKIIFEVLAARRDLKEHVSSHELDDYHCTLVALLIGKNVSIAVQIGDGAIIAGTSELGSKDSSCINNQVYTSLPENGEYKNETFFITEPHWLKHLRIKVFPKIDWFVMGSDGGIDIFSNREKFEGSLTVELFKNMLHDESKKSTVKNLINSEFALKRTNDDISCALGIFKPKFVGLHPYWEEQSINSIYLNPEVAPNTSATLQLVSPTPKKVGVNPIATVTHFKNYILSHMKVLKQKNLIIVIIIGSALVVSTLSYLLFKANSHAPAYIGKLVTSGGSVEGEVDANEAQPETDVNPSTGVVEGPEDPIEASGVGVEGEVDANEAQPETDVNPSTGVVEGPEDPIEASGVGVEGEVDANEAQPETDVNPSTGVVEGPEDPIEASSDEPNNIFSKSIDNLWEIVRFYLTPK
jgi:serine/threonine protein phosphatase PrpC